METHFLVVADIDLLINSPVMGCFPFGGGGDAVDKQREEAQRLKDKDRARINKEIEKGR